MKIALYLTENERLIIIIGAGNKSVTKPSICRKIVPHGKIGPHGRVDAYNKIDLLSKISLKKSKEIQCIAVKQTIQHTEKTNPVK